MSAESSVNEVSSSASSPSKALNKEVSKSTAANSLDAPQPGFGWTHYAEQINGRFAMVGFVSLLLLELFTRQDFFTWMGLR